MDTEDVRREVERAGRSTSRRDERSPDPSPSAAEAPGEPVVRVTLASLPRTTDVTLERDALMGFLQFGHRLDDALVARALALPFRSPALDAVRHAVQQHASGMSRPGWAVDAIGTVREPYRALGGELLAADFPAQDDAEAVSSTTDLARRLVIRGLDAEKNEMLGAIQRVPAASDEGRTIRLRLRELDAQRQQLAGEG
jgi:DNA primase